MATKKERHSLPHRTPQTSFKSVLEPHGYSWPQDSLTLSQDNLGPCVCSPGSSIIQQKLTPMTNQMQRQAPLLSTGFCKMLMEQEIAIKVPLKSSRDVL